jgi:hypothetical protein
VVAIRHVTAKERVKLEKGLHASNGKAGLCLILLKRIIKEMMNVMNLFISNK